MLVTSFYFSVSQAGAEYLGMTARNAASTPAIGMRKVLDGVLAYASEHTLVVVAAVLAFFMVARYFFTPRVR